MPRRAAKSNCRLRQKEAQERVYNKKMAVVPKTHRNGFVCVPAMQIHQYSIHIYIYIYIYIYFYLFAWLIFFICKERVSILLFAYCREKGQEQGVRRAESRAKREGERSLRQTQAQAQAETQRSAQETQTEPETVTVTVTATVTVTGIAALRLLPDIT